jgi:hypothetical protein
MIAPPLRFGIEPCGCLTEQPRWSVRMWSRCLEHVDKFIRVEAVYTLRRCESCRCRMACFRVSFGDGDRWLTCRFCDPWEERHEL